MTKTMTLVARSDKNVPISKEMTTIVNTKTKAIKGEGIKIRERTQKYKEVHIEEAVEREILTTITIIATYQKWETTSLRVRL